jgi:hypothetical protein
MLDGLTFLLALPDFIRNKRYPKLLRVALVFLMVSAVVAGLIASMT